MSSTSFKVQRQGLSMPLVGFGVCKGLLNQQIEPLEWLIKLWQSFFAHPIYERMLRHSSPIIRSERSRPTYKDAPPTTRINERESRPTLASISHQVQKPSSLDPSSKITLMMLHSTFPVANSFGWCARQLLSKDAKFPWPRRMGTIMLVTLKLYVEALFPFLTVGSMCTSDLLM